MTDSVDEIVDDTTDEVPERTTKEAEAIQPSPAKGAPQETYNDTKETAA